MVTKRVHWQRRRALPLLAHGIGLAFLFCFAYPPDVPKYGVRVHGCTLAGEVSPAGVDLLDATPRKN